MPVLKRNRVTAFNKFIHSSGLSSSVLSFREKLFTIAPYLWLRREYALPFFRFRIHYGPDICSLKKRGLLRLEGDQCRLCNLAVSETRAHLLLACIYAKKSTNWSSFQISDFISDSVTVHEDFYRIASILLSLCEALNIDV